MNSNSKIVGFDEIDGAKINADEQIGLIGNSGLIDEDWYRLRYKDVELLGIDPVFHFANFGKMLRRSPSVDFDTPFYLDTYADADESDLNPLVHYLVHGKANGRVSTRRELRSGIQELRERMDAEWGVDQIPLRRPVRPIISYCIPLMGRLDDLKGTLRDNLESHLPFRDKVEFLIMLFGPSDDALAWIDEGFGHFKEDGFLRVVTDDSLDSWHFCKAKNSFRAHMLGELYSSLDGDNFVTPAETQCILNSHARHDGHFLLHHFSGEWGDGTSGRVTLPAEIYRSVGYNVKMMPRQFDEIDLILSTLQKFPAMPLLCIDKDNHALTKSGYARHFQRIEDIRNRIIAVSPYERRAPLNPRGANYTDTHPEFRIMGDFNALYSGYTNTTKPSEKDKFYNRLLDKRHQLIDVLPKEAILDTLFFIKDRPIGPRVAPNDISLFMCVHNEEAFLRRIIPHYRALGVHHFFIVDDASDIPLVHSLNDPDIHVYRPKVGDFRCAKGLWLEALIKAYLPVGSWLLTIDADEFIHLPAEFSTFSELARSLETQGMDHAAGLLLDMLPAPQTPITDLQSAETDFATLFTHCCNMPGPPSQDYRKHRSIAWAFGPHAEISWRVDARYHAFGTFDSLRKIPFLRHRPHLHLNQGFHTLHFTDTTPSPGHAIWEIQPRLPIFHYKLVRIFQESARTSMLKLAASYHARTRDNIEQIFSGDGQDAIAALRDLEPFSSPAGEIFDIRT